MRRRLDFIQDWETLAIQASWSVAKLAAICHVSQRTLETYFRDKIGKTPKDWLTNRRQNQAAALLKEGCLVKEVATTLGYKHSTHFSREFRRYWGSSPTQIAERQQLNNNLRILV
jgi:AraC-like DNA-binding protein